MTISSELTGNDGASFESQVVARYIAALLCKHGGPGTEEGLVTAVRQQQRTFGDPLDDVVIEFIRPSNQLCRLSLQVKRALILSTDNKYFREIVRDSLKTLRDKTFNSGGDRFGGATGTIAVKPHRDLNRLCKLARASADTNYFDAHFAPGGEASKGQREIRAVIATLITECQGAPCDPELLHQFLKHFLVLEFRYSDDESEAVNAVRPALNDETEAGLVWASLYKLASQGAGRAQKLNRTALIAHLSALVQPGTLKETGNDPFNGLPMRDPSASFAGRDGAIGFNSLNYRSGFDAWLGREADLRFLHDFLQANQSFAWQLVYGGGGAGKSRLALHLLHHLPQGWVGGFINLSNLTDIELKIWRPAIATLIVVDYARTDIRRLGDLLTTLQANIRTESHPVRVLLLERSANKDWLAELREAQDGDALDLVQFAQPFPLPSLTDEELISLMEQRIVKRTGRFFFPRTMLLEMLEEIDRDCRPLFAGILAEAVADGAAFHELTRENLLTAALDRERKRLWMNAEERKSDRLPPDFIRHANLLALATMANELALDAYEALNDRFEIRAILPSLDPGSPVELSTTRLERMTGMTASASPIEQRLPPLEPDLLGELFVLRRLLNDDGPLNPQHRLNQHQRQALIDLAWQLSPEAMREFLVRASYDYPELVIRLDCLQPSQSSISAVEQFAKAQIDLIQGDLPIEFEREIQLRVRNFCDIFPHNAALHVSAISGASNLVIEENNYHNLNEARNLLAWNREHQLQHAEQEDIFLGMAAIIRNVLTCECNIGDLNEARILFKELENIYVKHNNNVRICEIFAQSIYNLMIGEGSRGNLHNVRNLFARLKGLQATDTNNYVLQEHAVKAANNLIHLEGEHNNLQEAREVFGELKYFNFGGKNDATIREYASKAGLKMQSIEFKIGNLELVENILNWMKKLQNTYKNDASLRGIVASAAYNTIYYDIEACDFSKLRRHFIWLKLFQSSFPNDDLIREQMIAALLLAINKVWIPSGNRGAALKSWHFVEILAIPPHTSKRASLIHQAQNALRIKGWF